MRTAIFLIISFLMLSCSGVRPAPQKKSELVVIVEVTDRCIADHGRWPWTRDVHGRVTEVCIPNEFTPVAYG